MRQRETQGLGIIPTQAILGNRFALRACFINYLTRDEDIEAVLLISVRLEQRAIEACGVGRGAYSHSK